MQAAVEQIPEWTLPETQKEVSPPKAESDGKDKEEENVKSASAIPSHLLTPGSKREETKRASRVLLQAVLENYADRGSTAKRRYDDNDEEEEEEDDDVLRLERQQ